METEDDFNEKILPKTTTLRVIKEQLPDGFIVSKEVKKMINLIASLFIVYVAAIAGEISKDNQGRKKKALVSIIHIIKALQEIDYSEIASDILASFQALDE